MTDYTPPTNDELSRYVTNEAVLIWLGYIAFMGKQFP